MPFVPLAFFPSSLLDMLLITNSFCATFINSLGLSRSVGLFGCFDGSELADNSASKENNSIFKDGVY